VTGRTRRCLNLGSYNYLGFAAADEYCTPRVLDTLADWGMSTCSARTEGGAWDVRVVQYGLGLVSLQAGCCGGVAG
jgi:serine palmitoyltransferase